MPEILLIGGGGHCRSCIDVIESHNEFKIAGIIEPDESQKTDLVLGYPVIGCDSDLEILKKKYDHAVITIGQIGSSNTRQKIFNRLKRAGFNLPIIIASSAYVSKSAKIEEGTVVMHRVVVNAGAWIGENCILNTGCIVEHDARIGGHTHISTGAVVNGGGVVGPGCFVGSNATVVQGTCLPDHYFFKAGRLITGRMDGKPVQ
jgi:sugar O-acyltransferase (sialic acid O-acetyltransferase NeuD family)